MVTRFKCNQSAKFDSFEKAAEFVYGPDWMDSDTGVFVHWGPQGEDGCGRPLLLLILCLGRATSTSTPRRGGYRGGRVWG